MNTGLDLLSKSELNELTSRKFYKAQCKVLAQLGIDFIIRPHDGFPLVSKKVVDIALGVPSEAVKKEPDVRLNL